MRTTSNLLLAGFALFILQANSCAPETSETSKEKVVVINLSPDDFQQQMRTEPGVLIDVRTPGEYSEAYIAGAVNMDLTSDDFKPAINKLDKETTYYVYCQSGSRSSTAAGYMDEIGFSRVYNLERGITAWRDMNLPVYAK